MCVRDWFLRCVTPFIVENPGNRFLRLLPELVALLQHPKVVFVRCDQCLVGTRWRKMTCFLAGNIDPEDMVKLTCKCSSVGGRCDRTHLRHQHLIGSDGTGGSWTSRAQNYPKKLVNTLAQTIFNAAAARKLCR